MSVLRSARGLGSNARQDAFYRLNGDLLAVKDADRDRIRLLAHSMR